MICAWVRLADGVVETLVNADLGQDEVPAGYRLVAVPPGIGVDGTWTWTETGGFVDPNPAELPVGG